jgi:hypothetical protein
MSYLRDTTLVVSAHPRTGHNVVIEPRLELYRRAGDTRQDSQIALTSLRTGPRRRHDRHRSDDVEAVRVVTAYTGPLHAWVRTGHGGHRQHHKRHVEETQILVVAKRSARDVNVKTMKPSHRKRRIA